MAQLDQYTVSLLHFDGNLTDQSGKVWSAQNGAATSVVQSEFGGSSLYLNGINQYLTTPNNIDFDFGSGDFTIDWWEFRTANSGGTFSSCSTLQYPGILVFTWSGTGTIECFMSSNGGGWDIAGYWSVGDQILNKWVHRAIVRNGENFYAFQNGNLYGSVKSSAALYFNNAYQFAIGNYNNGGTFPGYIDEFRISKGIARWTSNFTPPASPYSAVTSVNSPNNLVAIAGSSQISLSWTAVTGAAGYSVERSTTSGGPYTTIASNVTGTSYTDSTVTNGTTYYYVVTAVDSSNDVSANSNEASATAKAPAGHAVLLVTMLDSGVREYQLSMTEIQAFINWYSGHNSAAANCYLLNKVGAFQTTMEYLAFTEIVGFEVIPLN
jgi:hypothetical protein